MLPISTTYLLIAKKLFFACWPEFHRNDWHQQRRALLKSNHTDFLIYSSFPQTNKKQTNEQSLPRKRTARKTKQKKNKRTISHFYLLALWFLHPDSKIPKSWKPKKQTWTIIELEFFKFSLRIFFFNLLVCVFYLLDPDQLRFECQREIDCIMCAFNNF